MVFEIQADNRNTFTFVFKLFTINGLQFRLNSINSEYRIKEFSADR